MSLLASIKNLLSLLFGNASSVVDKGTEVIAAMNPEVAVEKEREAFTNRFRSAAAELNGVTTEYNEKKNIVDDLKKTIAKDRDILQSLSSQRQTEGADVNAINENIAILCDSIESSTALLKNKESELEIIHSTMTEMKAITDDLQKELEGFDARAKEVIASLKLAETQQAQQDMREQHLQKLRGYTSSAPTGLTALENRLQKAKNNLAGSRAVTNTLGADEDRQKKLESLRAGASQGKDPGAKIDDRVAAILNNK